MHGKPGTGEDEGCHGTTATGFPHVRSHQFERADLVGPVDLDWSEKPILSIEQGHPMGSEYELPVAEFLQGRAPVEVVRGPGPRPLVRACSRP